MKKPILFLLSVILIFAILDSCKNMTHQTKIRSHLVDTVGFAQYGWQLDSIMSRIKKYPGRAIEEQYPILNQKTHQSGALSP